MAKLTNKQLKFIDEYMIDLNGTQAAIRTGYSQKTAKEQAARLLSKVHIIEEIKKRQAVAAEKAAFTRDDKLKKLEQVIDKFLLDGYNTAQALKAIEIHNKMVGDNAADKIDQNINIKEQPLFYEPKKEDGE